MPTNEELNPRGIHDLDQIESCHYFQGMSKELAYQECIKNSLFYISKLQAIGGEALDFYLVPLDRYLKSDHSSNDNDVIPFILGFLDYRKLNKEAMSFMLYEVVSYCVENFEKFFKSEKLLIQYDYLRSDLLKQIE